MKELKIKHNLSDLETVKLFSSIVSLMDKESVLEFTVSTSKEVSANRDGEVDIEDTLNLEYGGGIKNPKPRN